MKEYYKIFINGKLKSDSKILEEEFTSEMSAVKALQKFRKKNPELLELIYKSVSIVKVLIETIKNIDLHDNTRTDKRSRKKSRKA